MVVAYRAEAMLSPSLPATIVAFAAFSKLVRAHDHGHSHIDEGETVSKEPLVGAKQDS